MSPKKCSFLSEMSRAQTLIRFVRVCTYEKIHQKEEEQVSACWIPRLSCCEQVNGRRCGASCLGSMCSLRQSTSSTGRTTSWSPKSQCVYGPENEIAAVTFFAKNDSFNKKQYFCKCNGMAGFRRTRLLIESL